MKTGAGFSELGDSLQAGREAAQQAVAMSAGAAVTFLFTTDDYDQEQVLAGVREAVGDSALIGICAAGIIFDAKVRLKGVGVQTLAGAEIKVATALQRNLSADPYLAGELAAEALASSGIEQGTVFVFPDGFGSNIAEMVRGLYGRLGPSYRYLGGGAGDNLKFFKTFQFTREEIGTDSVAVALVDGIEIGTGTAHGWKPIGDPLVTVALGKRLLEINGRPAFDEYAARFHEITAAKFPEYAMRYPLGFPDLSGNHVIRDPYLLNPDKTIDFVTEVPNNAVGSIMQGEVDRLMEAATGAARKAVDEVATPQFAIVCDCISRYLVMGEQFDRELSSIREVLGDGVTCLGALTFGEIGSFQDVPLLHNKTLAIAVGGSAPGKGVKDDADRS